MLTAEGYNFLCLLHLLSRMFKQILKICAVAD